MIRQQPGEGPFLGEELVEGRVDESNDDGEPVHGPEEALEIGPL